LSLLATHPAHSRHIAEVGSLCHAGYNKLHAAFWGASDREQSEFVNRLIVAAFPPDFTVGAAMAAGALEMGDDMATAWELVRSAALCRPVGDVTEQQPDRLARQISVILDAQLAAVSKPLADEP